MLSSGMCLKNFVSSVLEFLFEATNSGTKKLYECDRYYTENVEGPSSTIPCHRDQNAFPSHQDALVLSTKCRH
jgi:hypothetical protein